MRPLKITKPQADTPEEVRESAGQAEAFFLRWAALGSAVLSPEASALHPLIEENARFVASLAKQYQHHGVSQEALITAAHGGLITLLNQFAHRLDKLDEVLAPALRNAMATALQAQAGGSR